MRRGVRRFLATVAAAAMLAAGLVAVEATVTMPPTAEAADLSKFNPGNIISDTVFFNPNTMSVAQIQAFLNLKGKDCRAGSEPCLKDFRQNTQNKPKDPMCSGYTGAKNESAATIIYKVAKACKVNPQVILVTLQKEQGLVTSLRPTSYMYRSATGYGCPDTADCDVNYYGFFNQVYTGTWAFQRYTMPPGTGPGTEWYSTFRQYAPGKTVNVQYHPNAACGTKSVKIQNEATSSLYTYTPYTPNQAALNAGYGIGNACSAYGNRNFYNYFTDWFGPTQGYAAASQLKAFWDATGGSAGPLGYATNLPVKYAGGGVGQEFQRGWAYWHASTGAYRTSGPIGRSYIALGGPTGVFGYPTAGAVTEAGGGTSQAFQNGLLYNTADPSSSTTHRLMNVMNVPYRALGGPGGRLGIPLDSARSEAGGGQSQLFKNGTLYWSKSAGAFSIPSNIQALYASTGGPGGSLGYPKSEVIVDGTESRSEFEKGTISWSTTSAPQVKLHGVLAVNRIAAPDRYSTSTEISKSAYPAGAPVVYVVSGELFSDALVAAPAAAKEKGPLLLTRGASLPPVIKTEITRLKPAKIVVVGGEGSVKPAVFSALKKLAPTVNRVAGADRYAVAQSLAKAVFPATSDVYVATGRDFPDAITASAVAAAKGAPLILVDGKLPTISSATSTMLSAVGATNVTITGGPASVSTGIENQLRSNFNTTRAGGADRFEVSQRLNRAAFPTAATIYLASGMVYTDGLVGAAVAGAQKAPLYLVRPKCIPPAIHADIKNSGAMTINILGGTGTLSGAVLKLSRC